MAFTDASGVFLTAASAQTLVDAVRAFWQAINGQLPDEIVLTVSPVVDSYNEINDQLFASVSAATPPASVSGTSVGSYSMPAGMKINLNTGVIRDGRRVRGSIFVVPAAGAAMNAQGAVTAAVRTSTNTAANTLRTTAAAANHPLCVFSRPRDASATLPARVGAVSLVSACETNEKSAILRGRRD